MHPVNLADRPFTRLKGDFMEFAAVLKKYHNAHSVTFAIKLTGIRILPMEDRKDYKEFTLSLIGRQMDFIQSLHDLKADFAIDLRYLFDPEKPYLITICFLVRVMGTNKAKLLDEAQHLGDYLLNILIINNYLHDFELVTSDEELYHLINPFPYEYITEIIRREDKIYLDSDQIGETSHIGFGQDKDICEKRTDLKKESELYYVCPYFICLENMQRICHALFLQEAPCMISICLKPYQITDKDIEGFKQRIKRCEKYSQLKFEQEFGDISKLQPFLVKQANTMYENCSREFEKFQDAAFLQKVQIASSKPIPLEVITTMGASLTEHTGNPRSLFPEIAKERYIGGFDRHSPQDPVQFEVARQNLTQMEFRPWVPGKAKSGYAHWRYLFDVSQACTAFRLPIPVASEFPGINTMQYQRRSAPSDLPTSGILIGEHYHLRRKRKVFINERDRRRHLYAIGQTGTGKSTFFKNLISQDIRNGRGCGVIDPHGELIDEILPCIPDSRKEDVVYLNPKDYDFPVGINMLESRNAFEKDFIVNYMIDIFDSLYDLRRTGGPIFEMYMRNALQLLIEQTTDYRPTVLDVPRLFQDEDFRKALLQNCANTFVVNFWENEAEKAGGEMALANMAPYITSKLTRFVYNETMRGIIGQRRSTIDFRSVMDQKKILLVDLRKGILGDMNSHFLGMIVVGKIFTAALSRTEISDKKQMPDFYLYVDEFQNIATKTFAAILSEARKYRLCLTVTNQYIQQIAEDIRPAIFGNVGTLLSFRVGFEDATIISSEFGEVVSANDLIGLSNWNAYVRMLIEGNVSSPFNIQTLLPSHWPNPKAAKEIIELSRRRYGRRRTDVEEEIKKAWMD